MLLSFMSESDLKKFISAFEAEGFVYNENHITDGYETMSKKICFNKAETYLHILKVIDSSDVMISISSLIKTDEFYLSMGWNNSSFYLKDFCNDIEFVVKFMDQIISFLEKRGHRGGFGRLDRRIELDNEIILISRKSCFSSVRGFIESYDGVHLLENHS